MKILSNTKLNYKIRFKFITKCKAHFSRFTYVFRMNACKNLNEIIIIATGMLHPLVPFKPPYTHLHTIYDSKYVINAIIMSMLLNVWNVFIQLSALCYYKHSIQLSIVHVTLTVTQFVCTY